MVAISSAENDCFETPARMALSIARSATPESSGKEILQRFRQMVAQKSAERILHDKENVNGNTNDSNHYESSATDLAHELKSAAKSNVNSNGNNKLSIFKDVSVEKKAKNASNDAIQFHDEPQSRDSDKDSSSSSVKNRFKQSLAQRKSALQSRSVNVQNGIANSGTGAGAGLKKKAALASASVSKTAQSKTKMKSPMMKSELKSFAFGSISGAEAETQTQTQTDVIEESSTSMAMGSVNGLSGDDFTLGLDETVESEAVDSMEASANKSSEDCAVAETDGLISVIESCDSIESKSSSNVDLEQREEPPLTPTDSIQTFSVGSASTSASSRDNLVDSQGSGIRTCSIGGQSLNVSTDPFKTSIFQPSPVRVEELSMANTSPAGTEGSYSGETVVPDLSIPEGQIFPSPTQHMLYTSPTGKADLSMYEVSPYGSASSTLDDLSRQLGTVRLEKQESGRKLAESTSRAKKQLEMYDNIHTQEEKKAEAKKQVNATQTAAISAFVSVSPISKALATEDSRGLSMVAAASLIERNKTLVKEVRFADQTCVELSERNASLARQVQKNEQDGNELKSRNDSLQEAIIKASQGSARAEEGQKELKLRLMEERKRFELQLQEEKENNRKLSERLEESISATSHAGQAVAAVTAKYEAIHDEYDENKEMVETLRQRLSTIESTSELAASAAAQKYREASYEMERELQNLQDEVHACHVEVQTEREARYNAEEELSELKELCDELESAQKERQMLKDIAPIQKSTSAADQVLSSSSSSSNTSSKTTTSTVLAKTLREEIERGHEATERMMEAERIITVTQSKLKETARDLESANRENSKLRNKLRKYSQTNNAQTPLSVDSAGNPHTAYQIFDETSVGTGSPNQEMNQKLSTVRNQCHVYKNELDSIISQIQEIKSNNPSSPQASFSSKNSTQSHTLLQTVKEIGQICANVNVAASGRVVELEDRIQFLTQSVNQLNEICNEDLANISSCSMSLQMMEEGSSTPVKGQPSPMEVLYLNGNNGAMSAMSPAQTNASLMPLHEKSPEKIVHLKQQLSIAEEQLITVGHEKTSLESALVEAKNQIEFLVASAQESMAFDDGKEELLEENSNLEVSVLNLKSEIKQLENRIDSLQEDKAYLFDRLNELEDANKKIEVLEQEVDEHKFRHQQLSNEGKKSEELDIEIESLLNENSELELNLSAAEEQIDRLKADVDQNQTTIRDAEVSRIAYEEEIARNVDMIHQLQESLTQTSNQAKELKTSFMNCNEELAESVEDKCALEEANNQLQSMIRLKQEELDTQSRSVDVVSNQCENLKEKLSNTEDAYDALHEELNKMGSQVEVLAELNDEYESELTNAAQLKHSVQTELDDCRTKVDSLTAQIDDMKKTLDETNKAYAKSKSSLANMEEQFHDYEADVINEIQNKDEELSQLKVHSRKLEETLASCDQSEADKSREHDAELNRLKTKLEETEQQLILQRNHYQATSEQLEQLQEIASTSVCDIGNRDEEISNLRRKNDSLTRKCTRMREYVRNLTSKCKEWEETYKEKENSTQSFQRKYQEAMSKISKLTIQMNGSNSSASIASSTGNDGRSVFSNIENYFENKQKRSPR